MKEVWIYSLLAASLDSDITIFADTLPQDIDPPYCIFSIVNVDPEDCKDGQPLQVVDLQVSIFNNDTMYETIGWADSLKAAINGSSYTADGAKIQSIRFVDRDWEYLDQSRLHLVDDVYRLRVLE